MFTCDIHHANWHAQLSQARRETDKQEALADTWREFALEQKASNAKNACVSEKLARLDDEVTRFMVRCDHEFESQLRADRINYRNGLMS